MVDFNSTLSVISINIKGTTHSSADLTITVYKEHFKFKGTDNM